MADLKQALGTVDTFTVTNLHSLATSATAGWKSAAIDNSSNKFIDYEVELIIAAVNTAPANSKAAFLFAYGLTDDGTSDYTASGDGIPNGSEGTITLPDVTTLPVGLPLVAVVAYPVQNKQLNAGPFSLARCFGGILPIKFGLVLINHTGMTFAASGNALKGRGRYFTNA